MIIIIIVEYVILLYRNAHNIYHRIFFSQLQSVVDSKNLATYDNIEIGMYFTTWVESPGLKTGVMAQSLNKSGNTPSSIDLLNKRNNGQ